MNQILDYSTGSSNNGGGNKGYRSPSDKIARVFAIILAIFAVCLIVSGVMSWMKNKETEKNASQTKEPTYKATIETVLDEENETVTIIVDNEIEISKVIYNWNSNKENTIPGNGTTHLEKTIDLSAGNSTLNVKVIDIKNNETKQSFQFDSEVGKDIVGPTIVLDYQGGELIITAEDDTELSYITYRWNEEPETTVKVEEDAEDKTKLVETIDILMGENTITVIAVDAANNTVNSNKTLNGVTKPHIDVNAIDDGGTLQITCSHENGIKEISYTLNDRPYFAGEELTQNSPEVSFTQKLDEGYNRIILKVTSVDDVVAEFDGQCEYYPNGRPEETEDEEDNENTTNETVENEVINEAEDLENESEAENLTNNTTEE